MPSLVLFVSEKRKSITRKRPGLMDAIDAQIQGIISLLLSH